jgi:hypothetical protein
LFPQLSPPGTPLFRSSDLGAAFPLPALITTPPSSL